MPRRRILLLAGLGAAAVIGSVTLWIQASMLVSIGSLATGARGFQTSLLAAIDRISAGDYQAAEANYAQVEAAAKRINSSAFGPKFSLLATVPGLDTSIDNWRYLVSSSEQITVSTGELIRLFGDLSGKRTGSQIFRDGAIDIEMLKDLPPRVAAVDAGVARTNADLLAIDATGPGAGLLARARAAALREIVPVREAIDSLVDVAPLLPDALGANEPRRYLVAIGNQAEMRASGGAPLTLVLVEFNDGRITIPIKGQTSTQLYPPLNAKVRWWGPSRNPFFADNPRFSPMVVTNTHPSLLFSAQEMAGAWRGGGYPEVDGIITLDLTAIGAALNAIGPIQSEAYGEVTGDRLGQLLLVDAYQRFGQTDAVARQEANQVLLDQLLTRLLSGEDLISVAKAVAETAPGRHFQLWMEDKDFQALAIKAGIAGIVQDPGTGDWSAVYTQNGNQSKVDVFQQRNVLVTVQLAEDGSARVAQRVTVVNATPPDRPAEGTFGRIGYETMWLKNAYLMYVPDAATDYRPLYPEGFAVRPFKNHQQLGQGFANDGKGQKLVRVVGWTPPGGQASVAVTYQLPPGTFRQGDLLSYRLTAETQSLFVDPTITVRVTGPPGWAPVPIDGMLVTGETAEVSALQDGPVSVSIDFQRRP